MPNLMIQSVAPMCRNETKYQTNDLRSRQQDSTDESIEKLLPDPTGKETVPVSRAIFMKNDSLFGASSHDVHKLSTAEKVESITIKQQTMQINPSIEAPRQD